MRLLELIPGRSALLREKAELTERLAEEVGKRRVAEETRDAWQKRCEGVEADYRREVAQHQQDLRDTTDAMTRRFLMQNMFAKAQATAPQSAAPPQPFRPNDRRPAREVVAEKTVDFEKELTEYLSRPKTQ